MKTVFNLVYSVVDKLGRAKSTVHVGVFDSLEDIDVAKKKLLEDNPNITFEVYPIEHIFSEL